MEQQLDRGQDYYGRVLTQSRCHSKTIHAGSALEVQSTRLEQALARLEARFQEMCGEWPSDANAEESVSAHRGEPRPRLLSKM